MVPEPAAVRVTEEVPVTSAARAIESFVPVPCRVMVVPLRAPLTVMVPLLLESLRVNVLTVEAFRVRALALSLTVTEPPVLALRVVAAVLTVNAVGVPASDSVVVLPVLVTVVVPVVLAVMLVALVLALKVAALPARVTDPVLAKLSTKAEPLVLAVMLEVELPVVM